MFTQVIVTNTCGVEQDAIVKALINAERNAEILSFSFNKTSKRFFINLHEGDIVNAFHVGRIIEQAAMNAQIKTNYRLTEKFSNK